MKPKLRIGAAAGLAAALAIAAPPGAAQGTAYPVKPIRMIVASGAGGGLDFVARLVAIPLSEALGQSVVVDNRAGASGSIAAELASRAAPDGYTLMMLSASLVVYGIVTKTPYDLYRDFDPLSQVAASPYILTVHPSLPVKSVAELIAYAKANPAKLNFASTGNASLAHLAGELFASSTGTKLVHVPYKGVGAALTDLLSGQVQMSFLSGGSVYSQVRAQRLRALAIASTTRAKMAPELPTLIEAGVPGYAVTQWHGLLVPRGTPRAVIDRLHKEIAKAVHRPEVTSRLALDGTDGIASSPQEFAAHLRSERERWTKVAKAANISSH
ncbi:MAG: tripartite tricarboxylate transporter substrate binding protein [Betaproteobacteria bacterium]|nr:tripartite tricarboxylate transporter substrate binding protein [Betaproteobacteria bacterium]MBI2293157.1 tripartite tricarboxylate transporter substrate binding protein [Betaproteobacteria bacterium]